MCWEYGDSGGRDGHGGEGDHDGHDDHGGHDGRDDGHSNPGWHGDHDDSHNRSRGLLGIRSSFNVVECAVLSLKKCRFPSEPFLAALICDV